MQGTAGFEKCLIFLHANYKMAFILMGHFKEYFRGSPKLSQMNKAKKFFSSYNQVFLRNLEKINKIQE